eukprot:CAMPEP_0179206742 /NCGR_PEP_ID=MMETSP0796-20121207/103088_1 /TAXON_ID=73915 /ORGANISM="Pyrodinium bahamense, Strain pbaha01" /LENGTH=298 /DNA_ID=CAMNT_0020911665 /DNA_START=20 /DNA_END=917 /DNA_ORIENTATION=-
MIDLRASAPEFVPAARNAAPREDTGGGGSGFAEELPGDRLIRQLAAALAAAPATARPFIIPAEGLFCPDCIAGRPCAFHRPAASGWGVAQPRVAATVLANGRWPLATAPPPPSAPPAGPPPVLPAAAVCGEGVPLPHSHVCTPGPWHWPADERRGAMDPHQDCHCHRDQPDAAEVAGKGAAELDDTSTDVGGSEPHHAESDASDPSPDSASTASLRWRGQQRNLEAAVPHKGAAAAAVIRGGPAKQRAEAVQAAALPRGGPRGTASAAQVRLLAEAACMRRQRVRDKVRGSGGALTLG